MKILVTNFHLKDGGGHKTYINYLFNFLINKKFEVFLACPKSSHLYILLKKQYPDRVFNVEFPTKPREIFNILRNISNLRRIIFSLDVDIVHVNGSPDHKIIGLLKWLFKSTFKIIRTKHDSFPIRGGYINSKLYSSYTDKMIVVSNFQFDEVVINPSLRRRTTVIQNGIDVNYFKPMAVNENLRNFYNIRKKDIVFVSSAGTAEHKGWPFLNEAIKELDKAHRERIKVLVIGNKPTPDRLKDVSLENFIFTGYVDDTRPIVSLADVGFVLSYKVETISYACREMMAMAKPMIVSNFAGLPENVDNEINGWIVDTSNIDSIVQVLIRILSTSIESHSIKARRKSLESFDIVDKNLALLDIYKELIKK